MYLLKKQNCEMGDERPSLVSPGTALWSWGHPAIPVTQSASATEPGRVMPSASPSDPWLSVCQGYGPGQRLCGVLPGPRGVMGWEPPAGQPHGSQPLPGRQVLRELWPEPGPAVAKDLVLVLDFSYKLLWPQKDKGKGSPRWESACVSVCACVHMCVCVCVCVAHVNLPL